MPGDWRESAAIKPLKGKTMNEKRYRIEMKFSETIKTSRDCDSLLELYRFIRSRWSRDSVTIIDYRPDGRRLVIYAHTWAPLLRYVIETLHGKGIEMSAAQWANTLAYLARRDREERGVV